MSTSKGNCIWIDDKPEVKYTQIMKIADALIPVYMECATRLSMEKVEEYTKALEKGTMEPLYIKKYWLTK